MIDSPSPCHSHSPTPRKLNRLLVLVQPGRTSGLFMQSSEDFASPEPVWHSLSCVGCLRELFVYKLLCSCYFTWSVRTDTSKLSKATTPTCIASVNFLLCSCPLALSVPDLTFIARCCWHALLHLVSYFPTHLFGVYFTLSVQRRLRIVCARLLCN